MIWFANYIQRFMPKSFVQAYGEVKIIRMFLENFSGDGVRMLINRGFVQPGDHFGQRSIGVRWPFGPTICISPFNFPLEIPVLQMLGGVFMGNKVLVKPN